MQENWLSIIEYARKYNISDITVRRRIKTGRIHAILKEGKYYISAQQRPPEYIETRETKIPTPEPSKKIVEQHVVVRQDYVKEPYTSHGYQNQNFQRRDHFHNERPRYLEPRQGGSYYQERFVPRENPARVRETLLLLEKAITELKDTEKKVALLYEEKEENLKKEANQLRSMLEKKETELNNTRQQNEDLKQLVRVLETQITPSM